MRKFVKFNNNVITLYVRNCIQKFENGRLTGRGRFSVIKCFIRLTTNYIFDFEIKNVFK